MTADDFSSYERHFPGWASTCPARKIAMLSANSQQYDQIRSLYPQAKIDLLNREIWDISRNGWSGHDLIVCQNVFHYIKNPARALLYVRSSCRELWMQDLTERYRSGLTEFGTDGDCMRYAYLPEHPASWAGAYDLSLLGGDVMEFVPYTSDRVARHFLARIKGVL